MKAGWSHVCGAPLVMAGAILCRLEAALLSAHVGGLGAPGGPAEAVVGAISPGPFPSARAAAPGMLC